jgi:hypothetical protein
MDEFWSIVRADDARNGRFPTPLHTAANPGKRLTPEPPASGSPLAALAPPTRMEGSPIVLRHRREVAARNLILSRLGLDLDWLIYRNPDEALPACERIAFTEDTVSLTLSQGLIAILTDPDAALEALHEDVDPCRAPNVFTIPLKEVEQ